MDIITAVAKLDAGHVTEAVGQKPQAGSVNAITAAVKPCFFASSFSVTTTNLIYVRATVVMDMAFFVTKAEFRIAKAKFGIRGNATA